MLKQTEGSHAVAEAVALSRPDVICAYPISPQTHIVEALGEMVKSGDLVDCEFINVESEFAALSVAMFLWTAWVALAQYLSWRKGRIDLMTLQNNIVGSAVLTLLVLGITLA